MIDSTEESIMDMQTYLKNRVAFPLEELAKHPLMVRPAHALCDRRTLLQ